MMTLAVTASKFNKLPSELMGIRDETIALAFDIECADVLFQAELDRETEREKRQIEMLTGQVMNSALGGSPVPQGTNVERW